MPKDVLVGFTAPVYAVSTIPGAILSMRSWVAGADASCFPIQNLPYGVFSTKAEPGPRVGVAIGDQVLDLSVLARAGVFSGPILGKGAVAQDVFSAPVLNEFMALGHDAWAEARARLQAVLAVGGDPVVSGNAELRAAALVPQSAATIHSAGAHRRLYGLLLVQRACHKSGYHVPGCGSGP